MLLEAEDVVMHKTGPYCGLGVEENYMKNTCEQLDNCGVLITL